MTGAPEKYAGKGGIGVPCSQVRPLEVPGPQIRRLILECGVGVEQSHGQQRLNQQHHNQRHTRWHADGRVVSPPLRSRGISCLRGRDTGGFRRLPGR